MSDVRCDYCNGQHPTSQHNEQLPQPTPFSPVSTQDPLPCPDGSIPASKSYVNAKQAESGAAFWLLEACDNPDDYGQCLDTTLPIPNGKYEVFPLGTLSNIAQQLSEARAYIQRHETTSCDKFMREERDKLTRELSEANAFTVEQSRVIDEDTDRIAKLTQELSEARAEIERLQGARCPRCEYWDKLAPRTGDDLEAAKVLIKELAEGLAFYGEAARYEERVTMSETHKPGILHDSGERARALIAKAKDTIK